MPVQIEQPKRNANQEVKEEDCEGTQEKPAPDRAAGTIGPQIGGDLGSEVGLGMAPTGDDLVG